MLRQRFTFNGVGFMAYCRENMLRSVKIRQIIFQMATFFNVIKMFWAELFWWCTIVGPIAKKVCFQVFKRTGKKLFVSEKKLAIMECIDMPGYLPFIRAFFFGKIIPLWRRSKSYDSKTMPKLVAFGHTFQWKTGRCKSLIAGGKLTIICIISENVKC